MQVRETALVLIAVLAASALCSILSRADDGAVEGEGGAIKLMDEYPTVRLVNEHVHAWVYPDRDSVYVECIFFLRNDGPATSVLTAFPEQSWGYSDCDRSFRFFRSYIDGHEVNVKRTLVSGVSPRPEERFFWWTKEISFAANELKTVRNVYATSPGRVSDGSRFFCYVIHTGASWAGRIDAADIVVTVQAPSQSQSVRGSPGGNVVSGNELRWHFTDFEPTAGDSTGRICVDWK